MRETRAGVLEGRSVFFVAWCQELWSVKVWDFTHVQANKLACHSFMDAVRRYKTPGSVIKDLTTHGKWQHEFQHIGVSFSYPHVPPGQCTGALVEAVRMVAFHHSWGTPILGKARLLMMLQEDQPDLCPRGSITFIMLVSKINLSSASEGNNISIFQGCSLHEHPWKDNLEQKLSGSLLISCAEIWETMENCFPTHTSWGLLVREAILVFSLYITGSR